MGFSLPVCCVSEIRLRVFEGCLVAGLELVKTIVLIVLTSLHDTCAID